MSELEDFVLNPPLVDHIHVNTVLCTVVLFEDNVLIIILSIVSKIITPGDVAEIFLPIHNCNTHICSESIIS